MHIIDVRWNILSDFVQKICKERDESHGYAHMKAVAEIAKKITEQDFNEYLNFENLMLDVITIAWLHDVSDHKYDHDGTLDKKLDDFGNSYIVNFVNIKKAIKLISYSSENKALIAGTPLDYEELLGTHYALARHIVSDSDKLEAIGLIGIERCIHYTKYVCPESTTEQIIEDVKKHAKEKLLRLKDEFIRTPTGKKLAQQLHEEMLMKLADL